MEAPSRGKRCSKLPTLQANARRIAATQHNLGELLASVVPERENGAAGRERDLPGRHVEDAAADAGDHLLPVTGNKRERTDLASARAIATGEM